MQNLVNRWGVNSEDLHQAAAQMVDSLNMVHRRRAPPEGHGPSVTGHSVSSTTVEFSALSCIQKTFSSASQQVTTSSGVTTPQLKDETTPSGRQLDHREIPLHPN